MRFFGSWLEVGLESRRKLFLKIFILQLSYYLKDSSNLMLKSDLSFYTFIPQLILTFQLVLSSLKSQMKAQKIGIFHFFIEFSRIFFFRVIFIYFSLFLSYQLACRTLKIFFKRKNTFSK